MITPEAQKLIDELKLELKKLGEENGTLKSQIEQAIKAADKAGESGLFGGIFD